jgi:hypothetical protein
VRLVPQAVYNFWQYELCDVFIELMKPVIALDDAGATLPIKFPCCLSLTKCEWLVALRKLGSAWMCVCVCFGGGGGGRFGGF